MASIRDVIQASQVRPVDVGRAYGTGAQTAMTLQDLAARRDARGREGRLRELMAGGIPARGPERERFVSDVAREDPGMAMDWMKNFREKDAAELERDKAEAPFYVSAFQGVTDQATYDAARQSAVAQGLDVSDWPEAYDQGRVNLLRQGYGILAGMTPEGPPKAPTGMRFNEAGGLEPIPGYIEGQGTLAAAKRRSLEEEEAIARAGNPGAAQGKFSEEFGKVNAQQFFERRQGALQAQQSLRSGQDARRLLDAGVVTGFGANFRLGFGRLLQQAGVGLADDPVANTEAFVATRAQEVGRIIQLFGAGTGLSDADRKFAQQAAAGNIDMTESAIRRILDINDKASRNVIERFNRDAEFIDPSMSPFPLAVEIPEEPERRQDGAPATALPEGVTEEDIEFTMQKHGLSREEVLRRIQ